MIAFANIAHRIIGKPVESVMRTSRNRDNIPLDIAAIVSSKFTFSVTMSESSYHKPKKSYQVNSIIHSYGKQHILPLHTPNQSQLAIQDNKFQTHVSGNPSASHAQPSVPQTPSKILPLEHISLETPPKNTEVPPDCPGANYNM